MLKTVGNPSTRTGDQTIVNGNLVIGTSGKGIDFSATPGTGTSELLSDYEEGAWTPTFSTYGNASNGSATNAKYTKVGRQVTLACNISLDITVSSTLTYFRIAGFPFTAANTNFCGNTSTNGSVSFAIGTTIPFSISSALCFFPAASALANGTEPLYFTVTYFV